MDKCRTKGKHGQKAGEGEKLSWSTQQAIQISPRAFLETKGVTK